MTDKTLGKYPEWTLCKDLSFTLTLFVSLFLCLSPCMCVFAGSDWVRDRVGETGKNNFPVFASVINIKSSFRICQICSIKLANGLSLVKLPQHPLSFGHTDFKDNILWSYISSQSVSGHHITSVTCICLTASGSINQTD